MKLEQTLEFYKPLANKKEMKTYFVIGELESISASPLYTGDLPPMSVGVGAFASHNKEIDWNTPGTYESKGNVDWGVSNVKPVTPLPNLNLDILDKKPIGSISDFKLASSYGLGPGVAKFSEGFVDRYRAGEHEDYGKDHLNLEIYSPLDVYGNKNRIKPLLNLHIDMKE